MGGKGAKIHHVPLKFHFESYIPLKAGEIFFQVQPQKFKPLYNLIKVNQSATEVFDEDSTMATE